MMYSGVVFGLGLDWGIWGVVPGLWSWVGGAVVVGATVWGAMQTGGEGGKDEEYAAVAGEEAVSGDEESNDEENERLQ